MSNLWSDADASAAIASYAAKGVGEDLALRTYSARLLGRDPALVMHGGGNTSVKTTARDLFGEEIDVLCVKGSGWDLATIEPAGHPAVRLTPLHRLRALERLSDEEMVNVQRQNLMDSAAPNPSVETLLHAYIPHKFVDHTHSVAACALADQPDVEALAREVWGRRVAVVPYIMPGFQLAKAAADVFDANPEVEGLILAKHGIFSFGATAKESYERMIDLVAAAERHIAARGRGAVAIPSRRPAPTRTAAETLPLLRGALSHANGGSGRWIFDLRTNDEIAALLADERLSELATRGVSTPDHVIRVKAGPVVLPAIDADDWLAETEKHIAEFGAAYCAYFDRHAPNAALPKKMLDPLPRLGLIPGLGLVGIGRTAGEAAIAGDIGEAWVATLLRAEAAGRFEPVGEADLFDMEYWSLEQAKLGKSQLRRLAGQVVVVTGAAGAIGAATATAFAKEGAEIVALDIDGAAAEALAKAIGGHALGVSCDVTDRASVDAAFEAAAARFGGIDIVVSNAGAAWTGSIADLPDETLRKSFELNFFGHQNVAQAAVAVLRRQRTGGSLLFNVSKQAINPGADFGAYGASKAALLALVRQYALEHGGEGVRVNALNPDRIRSGLLTGEMIASRAASRGVSEADYMGGNLLKREVTADDVAQAFVAAALMEATTGAVIPVDGGNVAAMLR